MRDLAYMAEAAWSKSARLEAAIRDGLTPRNDRRPWNTKLFNPFSEQSSLRNGMSVADLHRLASTAKRKRTVKASEVRLKKNEPTSIPKS